MLGDFEQNKYDREYQRRLDLLEDQEVQVAVQRLKIIRELYEKGNTEDQVNKYFRSTIGAENAQRPARQIHNYRHKIHTDYYGLPWYGGLW